MEREDLKPILIGSGKWGVSESEFGVRSSEFGETQFHSKDKCSCHLLSRCKLTDTSRDGWAAVFAGVLCIVRGGKLVALFNRGVLLVVGNLSLAMRMGLKIRAVMRLGGIRL